MRRILLAEITASLFCTPLTRQTRAKTSKVHWRQGVPLEGYGEGMMLFDTAEAGPTPTEFLALTVKV